MNYTGFPPRFLALGQGYLWGVVPAQLPMFLAVLAGYVLLLHRSVIGRALYAIGFGAEGARYAGIPVERRIGLVYVLSSVVSAGAGIIYVAHLAARRTPDRVQARASTAVVMGGPGVGGRHDGGP